MHYLVYFIGPLLLKLAGKKMLRQSAVIFRIGLIAFFAAWCINQTIAGILTKGWHVAEGAWLYALVVSLAAGVFEETARYVAFGQCRSFRGNYNRHSSLMYAIGHNGAETIIVGATLLLIYAVVTWRPDAISDPALLNQCRQMLALGTGAQLYNAFERLLVGLLIHGCFSAVVMLGFMRGQRRFLFIAIGWHFVHDMIGFNLHRLSDHWMVSKGWVAIIIVVYTYVFVRLYRAMASPASPTPDRHVAPPMILPGVDESGNPSTGTNFPSHNAEHPRR
jgi:uncharacterized membrane protein YhfC